MKRASASKHADHAWTCPCGRTVHGNGGTSSHQRACRAYKQHRLDNLERVIADHESGVRPQREMFMRGWLLTRDRLRKELGKETGEGSHD